MCQRGHTFSVRLEKLIESINWVQQQAVALGCDMIVCGGDFFDKSTLTAEELTALSTIQWAQLPQYFLAGNHEMTLDNQSVLSSDALYKIGTIIRNSTTLSVGDKDLMLLPYIDEDIRKPLGEYLLPNRRERIIISHNDIKGIKYGKYISESGFSIDEIEKNCSLFINGHLHNCGILNDKGTIINLGNLCGQNFTEDASKYPHFMCVVDTDTLQVNYYENPYAINFHKVVIDSKDTMQEKLATLKQNAVVWVDTYTYLLTDVKEYLNSMSNIIARRVTTTRDELLVGTEVEVNIVELQPVDPLEKFEELFLTKYEKTPIILRELEEVCKR